MAPLTLRIEVLVGLSPSPCLRRVRILDEVGVIDRYRPVDGLLVVSNRMSR